MIRETRAKTASQRLIKIALFAVLDTAPVLRISNEPFIVPLHAECNRLQADQKLGFYQLHPNAVHFALWINTVSSAISTAANMFPQKTIVQRKSKIEPFCQNLCITEGPRISSAEA